MKFTNYFHVTRNRPDRISIKMEWIEQVFFYPEHEELQSDGRRRKWKYIQGADKYLRIIVMEDGETIHNAFFDRDFKK